MYVISLLYDISATVSVKPQLAAQFNYYANMFFVTLTDSDSVNFDVSPVIKLARRLLLRTASALVKVDKGKFLDDKITHSEHKDTSAREQWASIKTVLKIGGRKASPFKGSKRVPARADAQGKLAESQEEVALAILLHFAAVESAEICDWESLHAHCAARGKPNAVLELDIDNAPSKAPVKRMLATCAKGRAPGLDGILPDYMSMCPDAMVDFIYPFFLKCALRIQEPIEGKPSRAVDLYKGASEFSS